MDFIHVLAWMLPLSVLCAFIAVVALLVIRFFRKRERRRARWHDSEGASGNSGSARSGGVQEALPQSGSASERTDSYTQRRYNEAVETALDKAGRRTKAEVKSYEERRRADREARVEEIKRRRLAEAESKERVRSALKALSTRGYYIFDEIVSDSAGIADHLAVGPWGACIVVVIDHGKGRVDRDRRTDRLLFNRRTFEEDPDERGTELVHDIGSKLFGERGPILFIVCFTSADTERGERNDYPPGSPCVWDLAGELTRERPPDLCPEEVEVIAERVRLIYGREPYVRPTETEED